MPAPRPFVALALLPLLGHAAPAAPPRGEPTVAVSGATRPVALQPRATRQERTAAGAPPAAQDPPTRRRRDREQGGDGAPGVAPATGAAPTTSDALGPQVLELLGTVSEPRMQARVRELVAIGPRMGGTPFGEKAVQWRRRMFTEMGLASEVVDGKPRLCHQEDHWKLVVHGAGEPIELGSAWPWGFSPSAEGRVALQLDEADGVALLLARRPRGRIRSAPAIVLYDEETTPDGRYPVVQHLRSRPDNPYPVFGIDRAQGERLRQLLRAGPLELEYELRAQIREAPPRTVVARIPAREGAAPGYFLFCAHGDSDAGGPGANDNGSGEAIVLEVAQVLANAIAKDRLPAPGCELRFAIWGSEIHSTRHFLDEVVANDPQPILGVLNYDQAGFGSGADQLNLEPDDVPANRELILALAERLGQAGGRHGLPERWATNKSLGGTDSYVFSGSRRFEDQGLPAITVYTSAWDRAEDHPRTAGMPGESWSDRDQVHVDFDVHYHSAGDTPENTTDLEPSNMGWCARVGILAALHESARHAAAATSGDTRERRR